VHLDPYTDADRDLLVAELGRAPRGVLGVAHRCDHGVPAVVQTSPRLPDGTPFPTLFYLTCSVLNAALSRMESAGVMREMTARLHDDPELAARYRAAHEEYLAMRNALADLGTTTSAGGMPDRVKCLHALVAHSLAVGPGVNPIGDDAVAHLSHYWRAQKPVCVRLA
jgi:uncharacterized protein